MLISAHLICSYTFTADSVNKNHPLQHTICSIEWGRTPLTSWLSISLPSNTEVWRPFFHLLGCYSRRTHTQKKKKNLPFLPVMFHSLKYEIRFFLFYKIKMINWRVFHYLYIQICLKIAGAMVYIESTVCRTHNLQNMKKLNDFV